MFYLAQSAGRKGLGRSEIGDILEELAKGKDRSGMSQFGKHGTGIPPAPVFDDQRPQRMRETLRKKKRHQQTVIITSVIVGMLTSFVIKSILKGHAPDRNELVGTWVYRGSETWATLYLKADGTFDRQSKQQPTGKYVSSPSLPLRGTWTLDEGQNMLILAGLPQSA